MLTQSHHTEIFSELIDILLLLMVVLHLHLCILSLRSNNGWWKMELLLRVLPSSGSRRIGLFSPTVRGCSKDKSLWTISSNWRCGSLWCSLSRSLRRWGSCPKHKSLLRWRIGSQEIILSSECRVFTSRWVVSLRCGSSLRMCLKPLMPRCIHRTIWTSRSSCCPLITSNLRGGSLSLWCSRSKDKSLLRWRDECRQPKWLLRVW
mmetsp:Transcript_11816/g.17860  ORF Transcript_11816/g.17860 Transcript_11816/m.17860 type:complete len:205 (+) Transcript_11816:132-746(+)